MLIKEKTDFIDTQPELGFFPMWRKKQAGKIFLLCTLVFIL